MLIGEDYMIRIYPERFSISLTDYAYTLYMISNLDPSMTKSISSHCSILNSFTLKPILHLAELGRTREYTGENIDDYVNHFHESAPECSDPVVEDVLVDVCLHGKIKD